MEARGQPNHRTLVKDESRRSYRRQQRQRSRTETTVHHDGPQRPLFPSFAPVKYSAHQSHEWTAVRADKKDENGEH